jgi:hypothetical protein
VTLELGAHYSGLARRKQDSSSFEGVEIVKRLQERIHTDNIGRWEHVVQQQLRRRII